MVIVLNKHFYTLIAIVLSTLCGMANQNNERGLQMWFEDSEIIKDTETIFFINILVNPSTISLTEYRLLYEYMELAPYTQCPARCKTRSTTYYYVIWESNG